MKELLFIALVLACPLMMVLMMRGHGHGGHAHGHGGGGNEHRDLRSSRCRPQNFAVSVTSLIV